MQEHISKGLTCASLLLIEHHMMHACMGCNLWLHCCCSGTQPVVHKTAKMIDASKLLYLGWEP